MSFKTSNGYFVKNGKPVFLISGEIHYFRLNAGLWEKHLRLLKKAGANTISTYIPWDWHEYQENKFDFKGKTHPSKDLIRFIKLCQKTGLDLIVKPGPYILAEYSNQGLPGWMLNSIGKNAHALDENGNIIGYDLMSYMSKEFLHFAFLWFDQIMPVIEKYQESRGGPIIMMQLCNEVGVFQWLSGRIDYSSSVLNLYAEFLSNKYSSISVLNEVYGTNFNSFEDVSAPVGKIENKQEYCKYYDFHLFYRHYYALYLDVLARKVRSFGITVQLSHNIPGWIYGNASELPMLISTYKEIMRTRKDISFGLDHIPEFVSFRNAHSDLACNKILKALQPDSPVWAAEFQAGTREHHVKSDIIDLEMFYFASHAHGIRGMNYYMFSQGANPEGKGFFGKTFYYQTPLDTKAVKQPLYDVIKKVDEFINREKTNLLLSESRADISVGLYLPYFCTELISSQLLKEKRLDTWKLGLSLDPRFIREDILFNGLLRGLQTLNFNYDISDLENTTTEMLLKYNQLWVVTTELMDPDTQKLLVLYVKNGGKLVIYPVVPSLDLYLNPCTILKDEFKINYSKSDSSNKIDAFGIQDVFTSFTEKQIYQDEESEVVSRTKNGEVCGISKRFGKGKALILGYAFGYTTEEHLQLLEKIISLDGIKKQAKVSDPDIQFIIRKGLKYSYMFLLNYHNQRKVFKVNSRKFVLDPFSYEIIKEKL